MPPADGQEHRQVRQVVAHETDLTLGQAEPIDQRPEGSDFLIVALEHMGDPQLAGPALDSRNPSAREDRRLFSRPMPQAEGQAVADVEVLGLDSSVVEHNGTVGHHAVDVGDQKLDRLASRSQVGRRF